MSVCLCVCSVSMVKCIYECKVTASCIYLEGILGQMFFTITSAFYFYRELCTAMHFVQVDMHW